MTEVFANVQAAAPDAILGVTAKYLADPRPEKVHLVVGLYFGRNGQAHSARCRARGARGVD